ncbi:hypothetical protein SBADM41S_04802 [Streptomyces badius]
MDAGFVTRIPDAANSTVPVQLGTGTLTGWPMLVFCLGVLLTIVLVARKVKGAILISIVLMTAVAIVINEIADIKAWGLASPSIPGNPVAAPDFGLLLQFDLLGSFGQVSVLTVVLLVFTLILSDFFDTMGTVVGVTAEAGLLDERGQVPGLGRVLLIDGAAAVVGGATSSSSATTYIESAAGVGEGARTGFANLVTGGLFALALFLTPVLTIVPADLDVPDLLHLQHPARGHPRPGAERVEPEVDRGPAVRRGVLGHVSPLKGVFHSGARHTKGVFAFERERLPGGGPFPACCRARTHARINGFEHDTRRASRRSARAR